MTVDDVFEQAQKLSPSERMELIERLKELRERPSEADTKRPKTGAEIAEWLRQTPPVELVDDHIEDPVEWVQRLRADMRKRRPGDLPRGTENDG